MVIFVIHIFKLNFSHFSHYFFLLSYSCHMIIKLNMAMWVRNNLPFTTTTTQCTVSKARKLSIHLFYRYLESNAKVSTNFSWKILILLLQVSCFKQKRCVQDGHTWTKGQHEGACMCSSTHGRNSSSRCWYDWVPIWSEQPHYKHHSIRLKCKERVTCLLQWKGGRMSV